jgi:hypothetical protein
MGSYLVSGMHKLPVLFEREFFFRVAHPCLDARAPDDGKGGHIYQEIESLSADGIVEGAERTFLLFFTHGRGSQFFREKIDDMFPELVEV